jgi:DNA-directed RNA polymerase subunit alpha
VTAGDDPKRVATVVAEPLERGFGTTLGNSPAGVPESATAGPGMLGEHPDRSQKI